MNKYIKGALWAFSPMAIALVCVCCNTSSKPQSATSNDSATSKSENASSAKAATTTFKLVEVDDSIKNLHYTLKVQLPQSDNKALDEAVAVTFIGKADFKEEEIKDICRQKFTADFGEELESGEDEDMEDMGQFTVEQEATVCYENDNILTYNSFASSFTGGAHPNSSSTYTMFNKKNGKIITTLFRSDVKASDLQEIIINGLKKYFEVAEGENVLDFLMLDSDVVPMPGNAPAMVNDSIVFIYQQYEIAPYAAGMPSFTVPASDLRQYLDGKFVAE